MILLRRWMLWDIMPLVVCGSRGIFVPPFIVRLHMRWAARSCRDRRGNIVKTIKSVFGFLLG